MSAIEVRSVLEAAASILLRAPRRCALGLVVVALIGGSSALRGASCNVPSSYLSLALAVADPACTDVVLAPGTLFVGSILIDRDLSVQGQSSAATTIEGGIRVMGTSTDLVLQKLTIDATAASVAGCFTEALSVDDGAKIVTGDVVVLATGSGIGPSSFCGIFADGFESGGTSTWSAHVP